MKLELTADRILSCRRENLWLHAWETSISLMTE